MFRAREVTQFTRGTLTAGNPEERFSGVSTDSRTVGAGELFVALRGRRFDGHEFAEKAVERGAKGIIIEGERLIPASLCESGVVRIVVADTLAALGDLAAGYKRKAPCKTLAVTGSVGKTTVKDMIAEILSRGHRVCATNGNQNNFIGVPLTLFRHRRGDDFLVVEMGTDRPGEIERLTEIAAPDIGVLTHISKVHLEGMKDLATIAREKASLFESLPAHGRAVLRAGVPFESEIRSRSSAPVLTFGSSCAADVVAEDVVLDPMGRATFTVADGGPRFRVRLRLLGAHQVWNALAAFAACCAAGLPREKVAAGLEACLPAWGRLRTERAENGALLIEDLYNASPESVGAGLDVLASVPARRRFAVLGDMLDLGAESEVLHRRVGRETVRGKVDRIYYMGQFAEAFTKGVEESGAEAERVEVFSDSASMAARLAQDLREGDVALIKASRGMHFEAIANALKGDVDREHRGG